MALIQWLFCITHEAANTTGRFPRKPRIMLDLINVKKWANKPGKLMDYSKFVVWFVVVVVGKRRPLRVSGHCMGGLAAGDIPPPGIKGFV